MKNLLIKLVLFCNLIWAHTGLSSVNIQNIMYDQKTDYIVLDIQYGGGCEKHAFDLEARSSSIGEDGVGYYSYYLNHILGSEDPCKALIYEQLFFPMNNITIRPAVVNISTSPNGERPVTVSIPRYPKTNIESAYYDNEAQEIVVDISYSGGCAAHEFEFKISSLCLESYPQQCDAWVAHTAGIDDSCDAYIYETKRFDVSDLYRPTLFYISDEMGPKISVLVP